MQKQLTITAKWIVNKLTIFSSSCSLFADQPEIRAERPHVHSGPGHPFQLCCRFIDKNHTSRSFWFFCVLSGCFVVFQNVYKSFAMRADLDQHSRDHQLTWKGCEQDLGPKCLGCVTVDQSIETLECRSNSIRGRFNDWWPCQNVLLRFVVSFHLLVSP